MVTIVNVPGEGGIPRAIQGSSQDVSGPHRQERGRCSRGSSPSRLRRRLHHHHHPYDHGDLSCGGRRYHGAHGGADHGLRGRQIFQGLLAVAGREHGPHFRRRMHRSLSPHHLLHVRPSDGSRRSWHRGPRGHGASGPSKVNFQVVSFLDHHLHLQGQGPHSGSDPNRSSPLPAAIEQGIEQLGQLSLRSEPGPL